MKKILPWKVLTSKEIYRAGFFRLRQDQCELPDQRVMPRYYVMEFPNWVNVVPITRDGKMVLVEQYRHATGEIALEIPGGSTDAADAGIPLEAGRRELLEETGYSTKSEIQLIGAHRPNPAMQNNSMYTYIAWDCEKTAEQSLDPYEDIRVVTVPVKEVFEMLYDLRINHSIVMASIFLAAPHLKAKNLL